MDPKIPDKLYFKIGEVADIAGVKPHVLRYWESEFSSIRPTKSRSKQRLYRQQDIELILRLKDLLYNQGFTISGARKQLRSKAVHSSSSAPADPPAAQADEQMALPLGGSIDRSLLDEIKQDVLLLKKSLNVSL
jgi:DNA-binding transcriptional MerR regulator